MNNKLAYLLTCTSKIANKGRQKCPSCGNDTSDIVSRKHFITALRRCKKCSLLFRTPTTTSEENAAFYQEAYSQGFTTDVPSDSELEVLKEKKFSGTSKDFTRYIDILSALGAAPGDRLLDFGCSWGYGSWQMQQHGFEVTSFEVSKPRCRFAREKLQVNASDSLDELTETEFDVFFSSHVLEHVPSVSDVFQFARTKLKKGGVFVSFTPNGSEAFRCVNPGLWSKLWGMVHPNYLDDQFYKKAFGDVLLASAPYDCKQIESAWNGKAHEPFVLDDRELMAAVRMT